MQFFGLAVYLYANNTFLNMFGLNKNLVPVPADSAYSYSYFCLLHQDQEGLDCTDDDDNHTESKQLNVIKE